MGRGHVKRYPLLMYGEERIEIVDSYTYLGIPFTGSALFTPALKAATSKTKLVISTTTSLINKLNPNSWNPVNKFFESFISGTLLYTVIIWGLRYMDELEKIQLEYYKSVLNLSKNTPNYAVRIETGRRHISLRIFKMVLKWL